MLEYLEENGYEILCEQMAELLRQRKELERDIASLKEEIILNAGGDRMEYGIKVTHRSRKGAYDYNRILEDGLISEELLDRYRKPNTEFWEVTSY